MKRRVSRSQIKAAASEISAFRPPANPSLEQFLMEPESMVTQVELLENKLGLLDNVVFIGDDDHISLLMARFCDVNVSVFDIDQRVVESINTYATLHRLQVHASLYDVRDEFPDAGKFNFFYINPPYSSKNNALGVKVWLMRALDAIRANGEGVLVFPAVPENKELEWVASTLLEITRYLVDASCIIYQVSDQVQSYYETNDKYLYSTNYLIRRVGHAQAPRICVPQGERLYR